jgi:peptidoglycan biosynthesis protein MviN/MurJ (putative lipid II flippase)
MKNPITLTLIFLVMESAWSLLFFLRHPHHSIATVLLFAGIFGLIGVSLIGAWHDEKIGKGWRDFARYSFGSLLFAQFAAACLWMVR